MRRVLLCVVAIIMVYEAPMAIAQTSLDLTLEGEGYTLPATLERAPAEGPTPCVVFFAGSGPTDRNWCSLLLPGDNGSAQQLAEALRDRGISSLRFDKVGSAENMAPLDILSLDHYRDEGELAYRFLSARETCGPIFLLGNSEGALHAMRVGEALQSEPDFGGVISLAGPSDRIIDHVVEQVTQQATQMGRDVEAVNQLMSDLVAATDALPTLPDPPLDFTPFPEAEILWAPAIDPLQGRVVRELLLVDPLQSVRSYRGAALVVSAENDVQVSGRHGDNIYAALPSESDQARQRLTVAGANHVFKAETRSPADTSAQVLTIAYTEAGRPLAPGIVDAIVGFIEDAGR